MAASHWHPYSWVKERLLARRLLLSCDGPYDNVIKIKPPMVFGAHEADRLLAALRWVCEGALRQSKQYVDLGYAAMARLQPGIRPCLLLSPSMLMWCEVISL